MKRALVTGASGFIGRHLVKDLIDSKEYDVAVNIRRSYDNSVATWWLENCQEKNMLAYPVDLVDSVRVKDMLDEFNPDIIFHLAANPNVKMNDDRPTDIIQSNVTATQNICHFAPEGCRVVFASSVVVYGSTPHKCREDHACRPTSVYAATKLAGEGIVHAYDSQNRIRGTSLRLCATVGTGLTHGIVYDFIRKMRSGSYALEMLGAEPGTRKPFTHVDDVVQAFKLMTDHDNINSVYNVVPDNVITVKEVAQAVMGGLGEIKPMKWLGEQTRWRGDNDILNADNQRIKYRGWKPKFSLSECAIIKAVEEIVADA